MPQHITLTAAEVASRLHARRAGSQWQARCPAHDDRRASLSIGAGDDGRVLLHCHAGCSLADIMAAAGLSHGDISPGREQHHNGHNDKPRIVAQYDYRDEAGNVLFQVVRYHPKDFRQRTPDGKGGWTWSAKGIRRVLYRLPELLASDLEVTVFVVEGEKDCDRLAAAELIATTNVGGAGKWLPEYSDSLRGRRVVVLPDNDEPGRAHAESVARSLRGTAASVRVLELPDLPPKGDVSDWLASGTFEALMELADAAAEWQSDGDTSAKIPQKTDLLSSVTYTPFPVGSLPETIGRYVTEAASAIGCDAAFVALPLLCALARAVGNARIIRLKRTWTEPAIVWAAIIGKSGSHKTPALAASTASLHHKQAEALIEYDQKMKEHETAQALYERDYAAWKRAKSTEPPPWEPVEPALKRYIVSDITIEALADRLHRQYDGVLVVRDELAGWLGGIAEYKGGKGSDLGHWLAAWSAQPLTVDRKTGAIKTIHVPRAAVSLVGGIQPAVLRAAIGREHMQDGLCARLLLAMPDPRPVRWSEATVDSQTEAALAAVIDGLLALEPAADSEGRPEPYPLDLTPEAKGAWVAYYDRHRAELAELGEDLAAAWSKLEAYAARLALIIQLATNPRSEAIDQVSIEAGIRLADWFGGEAQRVYRMLAEPAADREQRELVEWIQRQGGRVTVRDVQRSQHGSAAEIEESLTALVTAGYGTWETTTHTAGRPRVEFVVRHK